MRNAFSTAIIAFALTLDMPAELPAASATLGSLGTPEPGTAWVMALGFLGFVILRRMRG